MLCGCVVVATDTGVPDMNSFASFLDLEPFAAAAYPL
jgi:hypothetical protein